MTTLKQRKEIIKEVGKKVNWRVDWYFPFIHREVWVFGGWCGFCGKWNWQWREEESIFGTTYPCKECLNKYK